MNKVKKFYSWLHKHPYLTHSIVSGVITVSGDFLAQKIVEKKENLDKNRSLNFLILGGFTGLVLRKWFGIIDMRFKDPNKFKRTLKKVAVTETLFSPMFIATEVCLVECLKFKSPKEIKESFSEIYLDILKTNYKVWPAAEFVNFYFTPLRFQVVFSSIVAVFWNTYFSYKLCSDKFEDQPSETEK